MCMPEKRSGTRISTGSPTSSARCVAEQLLDLGVDQDDRAVAVDDDHAVGRASSRPRKSLVWRYLSLGSRMPIATTGPRSVRIGVIVRSTWCEHAAGVPEPGVAHGDLDAVRRPRRRRRPAGTSCMVSRPKSSTVCPTIASAGMPTTSPAPCSRAGRRPARSTITSASSDLSTVVRERAVLPRPLVVQLLHVVDPP